MTKVNSAPNRGDKRVWAAPEVRRVRAGDAEQNAGSFADGPTNSFS